MIDKLVLNNCFLLGQASKLTNKNFTRCLLGTRSTFEIFKLYEIRYLLLRIYPLIYSLFCKDRSLYGRMLWRRSPRVIKKRKLEEYQKINPNWDGKIRFYPFRARKNIPPKILFASTSRPYAHIIEDAARRCQMPWQTGEWLKGSITGMVSPVENKMRWHFSFSAEQAQMEKNFSRRYGGNKEDIEYTQEKKNIYEESYTPALIVIPDVKNNLQLIAETREMGVPILGLVSSDCQLNIDYPIFSQDMSVAIVHFFCHFLSTLIAKEMAKIQHKLFTKTKSGLLKRDHYFFKKPISFKFRSLRSKLHNKYHGKKVPKIFRLQEHFLYAKKRRKDLIRKELILPWWDRFNQIRKTENEEFMDFELFYYFFYETHYVIAKSLYTVSDKKEIKWESSLKDFVKNSFLRDKRYLSLLFEVFRNSYVSEDLEGFKANIGRTADITINNQWAKRKTLLNQAISWTSREQKRVFLKAKKNPGSFEKILQQQWNRKKGRLRYNNANKMYYWTPLRLLLQALHFKALSKRMANFRRNIFYRTDIQKNAYQKYKTTWWNDVRRKLLRRVGKKKALTYFFSQLQPFRLSPPISRGKRLWPTKQNRKKDPFLNCVVQANKEKKTSSTFFR